VIAERYELATIDIASPPQIEGSLNRWPVFSSGDLIDGERPFAVVQAALTRIGRIAHHAGPVCRLVGRVEVERIRRRPLVLIGHTF